MSSRRRNNQEQKKPNNQPTASGTSFPWFPVIAAIIASAGYVIVALINRSTAIETTLKPIEFTQTAEALHTFAAMTATEGALQTQTQAANITMTAFSGTQTASAIQAEIDNSAIFASQTAESQAFKTQTAIALAIPTPTEVKPIKYEHVVGVGETLSEISKKYFIVDFYSDAIGKANCNLSPKAGDILIIRYFYLRAGDTIDTIAENFSSSSKFLRSINNLSQEVIFPPVGQIFILPGSCSK